MTDNNSNISLLVQTDKYAVK